MLGVVVKRTNIRLTAPKVLPSKQHRCAGRRSGTRTVLRTRFLRGSSRACAKARIRRRGADCTGHASRISQIRPLSLCFVGFSPETAGPFRCCGFPALAWLHPAIRWRAWRSFCFRLKHRPFPQSKWPVRNGYLAF